MAKKQPAIEKRDETPLSASLIRTASENISDLAKTLSDVAGKMDLRSISSIDSKGWRNLNLAIEKLGGAISSVERAYRKASVDAADRKVSEEKLTAGKRKQE